jgi:hypothetical protein
VKGQRIALVHLLEWKRLCSNFRGLNAADGSTELRQDIKVKEKVSLTVSFTFLLPEVDKDEDLASQVEI